MHAMGNKKPCRKLLQAECRQELPRVAVLTLERALRFHRSQRILRYTILECHLAELLNRVDMSAASPTVF